MTEINPGRKPIRRVGSPDPSSEEQSEQLYYVATRLSDPRNVYLVPFVANEVGLDSLELPPLVGDLVYTGTHTANSPLVRELLLGDEEGGRHLVIEGMGPEDSSPTIGQNVARERKPIRRVTDQRVDQVVQQTTSGIRSVRRPIRRVPKDPQA